MSNATRSDTSNSREISAWLLGIAIAPLEAAQVIPGRLSGD